MIFFSDLVHVRFLNCVCTTVVFWKRYASESAQSLISRYENKSIRLFSFKLRSPIAKCAGSTGTKSNDWINNRTRRFSHVRTSGPPAHYEIENFRFGATKN